MKRTALIAVATTVFLACTAAAQTTFSNATGIYGTFAFISHYTVGDLDGDLIDDIVVSQASTIQIKYLGAPGEGQIESLTTPSAFMQPFVADIDGDQTADVVAHLNGTVSVFRQSPTGFVRTDHSVTLASLGDINNDAAADIVTDTGFVALNDGSGGFLPPANVFGLGPASTPVAAHTLTDLDGDGDLDVAVLSWYFSTLTVTTFENDGTGVFSPGWTSPPLTGDSTGEIHAADLDGDGDEELLVRATGTASNVTIFENTGPGLFVNAGAAGVGSPQRMRIADFNGDGRDDVVVKTAAGGGSVSIFLGGPGAALSFDTSHALPPQHFADGLEVGHMNLDGAVDIVVDDVIPFNMFNLPAIAMLSNLTTQQNEVDTLNITSGDGQLTVAGSPYATPMTVRLTDGTGAPVPSAIVRFGVRYPASVTPSVTTTDANGFASTNVHSGPAMRLEQFTAWTETSAPVGSELQARGPVTLTPVPGSGITTITYGRPHTFVVSATDTATGTPLAGIPVQFTLYNPEGTAWTDAAGLATLQFNVQTGSGPTTVTASNAMAGPFDAVFDIYVRALGISWINPTSTLSIAFDSWPPLPFVLAMDSPQPTTSTIHGPVETSIFAPSPDLLVLDGIGFGFWPYDPTLVTTPTWGGLFGLPPGAFSGQTRVFQIYGYDPGAPWPHTFFTSNTEVVNFP